MGIGMILVLIGILVIVSGTFFGSKENNSLKSAGIIFVGPFPIIGWGGSRKMYYSLLALGLVLFFFMMFFLRSLR